jgi:hypothetical protein
MRPEDFPIDRPKGASAFDFLFGRWRVHNRRLWQRLADCDDWEEFSASLEVRPVLGGLGNVDQFRTLIGGEYFEGLSLRLFSIASENWSIYWTDTSRGEMLPPLVGEFEGSVGSFFGDDTHNGQIVRVRFLWESIDDRSARWQQAYSVDGGKRWETNWIMNLERD